MKSKLRNKETKAIQKKFFHDIEFRVANRKWLRYSSQVARRVIAAMKSKENLTQLQLAKQINVSPQRISKILKGQDNLTLSTIAKLSEALGTELIEFPKYEYQNAIGTNRNTLRAIYPSTNRINIEMYELEAINNIIPSSVINLTAISDSGYKIAMN
jgi:transcriptional regulator with XRE-family HTH domain